MWAHRATSLKQMPARLCGNVTAKSRRGDRRHPQNLAAPEATKCNGCFRTDKLQMAVTALRARSSQVP
jgi:hypothetical protein